jgi:hypothetical protein
MARSLLSLSVRHTTDISANPVSWLRSIRGYIRVLLNTRPTMREFDRVGLTDELLAAHAAEIDAATPDFAQTRGRTWYTIGPASAAYLALLRRVPDGAGPDAVVAEFRAAARRGYV